MDSCRLNALHSVCAQYKSFFTICFVDEIYFCRSSDMHAQCNLEVLFNVCFSMKYIFVLFNFLTPRSVKKLLASHIHTQHNTIQYNYFLDSPGGMLCCSVEPFMFFVWRCDCVQCTVHVNLILKWLFRGTIHIGSDKADSCSIAFIFKTQNENKIGFAFLNTTAVQSTAVQ